jgi:predicted neuraminidase
MRHSERIYSPNQIEVAIRDADDWTLRPSPVEPNPGPEHRPEVSDFTMSMGIERTPKGRLWVSWFGGDDSRDAYILLAKSDDDGNTWSDPLFMVDPEPSPNGLRQRALVGNLWTDPQGRLWMFFDKALRFFDGRAGVWATVCANPDDEVPVWSEPKRIGHGATLNKPTVLANGDWLLPVSLWQRDYMRADFPAGNELFKELDPQRMANVFVSKDRGASWTRRGGVLAVQRQFDEQMIVERRDGSLLMFLRTDYGIAETESFDQGRSWTAPERSALEHVSARIFVRRLASGRVLLVKHGELYRKPAERSHLTAYLSDDDCKTWKGGLLLDERAGVSYPDGFQAPDGLVTIAYDRKRIDGEILMATFAEEDVLSGAPVSGRVRLRVPVKQTQAIREGRA